MPELPEVEIVKQSLSKKIERKKIKKIIITTVSYTHLTLPTNREV